MYKREEDGIVLVDSPVAAGGVTAYRGARTRRCTSTGRRTVRKSVCSAIRASKRASRPCVRTAAWAASGTWASCCTMPTGCARPPRIPSRRDCISHSLRCSSIPTIPPSPRSRTQGHFVACHGSGPAFSYPQTGGGLEVGPPLHPEFRTLPMVWYVPPTSPLVSGGVEDAKGLDRMRIPVRYLANLLAGGR